MKKYSQVFNHRYGPLAIVVLLVVCISFITRVTLMIKSWPDLELSLGRIAGIYFIGLFYDLVVASFFCIPVALYCWLMKDSWYQSKFSRVPLYFIFFIITLILVVNAGAEFAFWDEFGVRFNFIAVDYLVYTNEVLGNIRESYNIPMIVSAVLITSLGIFLLIRKKLHASQQTSLRFGKRSLYFLLFLVITSLAYFGVNNHYKNFSSNNYVNELGGAGIYEFGAAFWNNEIDYTQFYRVNNDKENMALLRSKLRLPGTVMLNDPMSLERVIKADSAEHRWNVVLISVESLSGDFMKYFGNSNNVTPYLDSLIPHSLFFKNFYATGTRTVRGLEALSLAIPPTPGQSIVRRPSNEDMFTMGAVLKDKGYDVHYIYGGNSFFDNMGYFFSHNGYQVIDRRDIPDERVHHETAWGVADEDAFGIAIDECDKSFQSGKPFFNHIMTVSNHRPYTYPEGRIDIPPSKKWRDGAVKYTDYSINKFLKDASGKPWFNNTLFVIVADHCASSAGKTDLPISRYHIPCLIYSPALIQPAIETRMTSQIDLAPTLFGLMNLNYTSKFMGYDLNKLPKGEERVFISTYQDMGFWKNDTLVILSPKKKVRMYLAAPDKQTAVPIPLSAPLLKEAIAWYQGASFLFKDGRYKWKTD